MAETNPQRPEHLDLVGEPTMELLTTATEFLKDIFAARSALLIV
jgi:hypothetical protein